MTAMKVWLLPEPLSPTTPRVSPRGDLQRDAADRVDHPVMGIEKNPQLVDREDGRLWVRQGVVLRMQGKGGT